MSEDRHIPSIQLTVTAIVVIIVGIATTAFTFLVFLLLALKKPHFVMEGGLLALALLEICLWLLLRILLRTLAARRQGQLIGIVPNSWEKVVLIAMPALIGASAFLN